MVGRRSSRAVVAALCALLATSLAGCGEDSGQAGTRDAGATTAADTTDGAWLLRFATAEGADGERAGAVYVRYDPATGTASSRSVPAVAAADASQDEQVLLVSADQAWAIPDTGVPKAERRSGRLQLYSLDDDATKTLDIRDLTGEPSLNAVAWAFDPVEPHVLRVVDADRRVFAVDLEESTATEEGRLEERDGWIFANGFDKTSGEPYIESIDSDETEPDGNGDSDVRPVERQGGALFRYDGSALDGLPEPPCGFASGFDPDDGAPWLFCADTPSISAFTFDEGSQSWEPVGKPSPAIVPGAAVDLTFALPPVG